MPKSEPQKLGIRLDLLRPQSNPEKIFTKMLHWLLSSGRFIFIFVEALVLIAFITRFKLDADLADYKDKIDDQIRYIESQKSTETLIRQTQLKLSTISSFKLSYADYPQILKKIADQTPTGLKITSFNLERNITKVTIQINAIAQSNNDLATFIAGLKQDPSLSDINVTSISYETGSLNFSISATTNLSSEGKNL